MNKLFGIALFLAGLMLAVGAGANFRYFEADRDMTVAIVSDDSELIDLTPVQPYVYLNNGKLTVEISSGHPEYPGYGDGLSTDSLYVFEEMFNVSNELWENAGQDYPICVTIKAQLPVKVFAGTYDSPIAGPDDTISFTVYHGQPVPVGMIFDNTGLDLGGHQIQLDISAVAGECE
ncbi:DUF1102 domain-containing protein [Pyrococcus abyssi]|uniref:DUF1102 domain-containing protein n=1 Tax=Pyrococcus abyssi (strain GE5 / Orsay) TaxID=272844 RepID=Q9UYM6_PYRAB|nr:DUF1102 domain-containing protein [Pyrococcus abyssi]CAB50386.1 Hypothetical protein PAB0982 [Pyrococcus abyssi GE5]CCE70933.1 TPA: hypothetical protein PAB0982 [Pyrococcus abyssi GE5]